MIKWKRKARGIGIMQVSNTQKKLRQLRANFSLIHTVDFELIQFISSSFFYFRRHIDLVPGTRTLPPGRPDITHLRHSSQLHIKSNAYLLHQPTSLHMPDVPSLSYCFGHPATLSDWCINAYVKRNYTQPNKTSCHSGQ